MIDELCRIAAKCLEAAMTLFLIALGFGMIVGSKRGTSWVMRLATSVVRRITAVLTNLAKRICFGVLSLIRHVVGYIYGLSKVNWMPSSRFRGRQSGIRIQRLSAWVQDNNSEHPQR